MEEKKKGKRLPEEDGKVRRGRRVGDPLLDLASRATRAGWEAAAGGDVYALLWLLFNPVPFLALDRLGVPADWALRTATRRFTAARNGR